MAKIDIDTDKNRAVVLDDDADPRVDAPGSDEKKKNPDADLVSWVVSRVGEWRDHRRATYEADWDRWERLWRGIWSASEKLRESERSKFVSPALSEAVENGASEIEEAVFGRGDFFDFQGEKSDAEALRRALERNKIALKEDLSQSEFAVNTSECIVNAAVYGTGIGEVIVESTERREIIPVPAEDGTFEADVQVQEVDYACLKPVNPRNFLIDPNARTVKDALGVAVEENVGLHLIQAGQESGEYNATKVAAATPVPELEADKQKDTAATSSDTAHVIRYYGLVPKHLLFPKDRTADLSMDEEDDGQDATGTEMVESIVVIANQEVLLKAVENPYLMKDRPIVAFQWDVVPGRFWGRGICEKGEMPQRVLDAEIRSRIDALGFTGSPMMGMDATRIPRGFKFEVKPGKSILTAGDPSQILKPFQFGQLDANTFQQGQMLDQMVQRATGSVSGNQLAQQAVGGEARSGAVSMSLSGVVKRNKRTLMRFIDQFFIPALKKLLWRNMQFAPGRYIPLNSTFVATTAVGIMQREYENLNLTQMLAAMQPGSPEHRLILAGVVQNTGLKDRQQIADLLKQAAQPQAAPPVDPMAAQIQQLTMQLQIAQLQAQIAETQARTMKLQAEAGLTVAKTQDIAVDNQLEAQSIAMKGIYNTPEEQMAAEFDRRLEAGRQMIEAQKLQEAAAARVSDERIVRMQTGADLAASRLDALGTVAQAAADVQTAQAQPVQ